MSDLIVHSVPPDQEGKVLSITPVSAGWKYVGFEAYRLVPGQSLVRETNDKEACVVLLSGRGSIATNDKSWSGIGERMSLFEDARPFAVYVPSNDRFAVEATTDLEIAVGYAPGKGHHGARLITPEKVGVELRGTGTNARKIQNILPDSEPADSLLMVEVFTPAGHWSSYPPHKHDQDNLPEESFLEETYYYRIYPSQGFAFQRVYTDDRSLDETMTLVDGDVVCVPRGYHPVAAPPGYDVYYLNVMAGPVRQWRFRNDAEHAWLFEAK